MARDFMHEVMEQAIEEIVVEKINNGSSREKIEEELRSDVILKAYKELIDQASNDSVETIENIMYEKVLEERACTDIFLARQNQKWRNAFVASDMLYICILKSAELYTEYVNEMYGQNASHLFRALRYIHGRALQIYLEIVCLNKNGFADGAYARWRSLFELSVISSFIKRNGNKIANAFMKSADSKDRYEWARTAKSFKNYPSSWNITFDAIQSRSKLATKEWKREYKFVNQLVHASPQGTKYRIGADMSKGLLVGRSDSGMTISAVQSAISLVQITIDFFTVYSHSDSILAIKTFRKWIDIIIKYYEVIENDYSCIEIN